MSASKPEPSQHQVSRPNAMDAAELAHELRQPLFAIKALTQFLGRESKEPRLAQLLAHVQHIESILERQDPSFFDAPAIPLDLGDPIQAALDILRHRAEVLGCRLDFAPSEHPLRVLGRPTAITQIAVNLVHNALDAAGTNEEAAVRVRIFAENEAAVLEVRDTGPGLSLDVRARLGQPFVTTKPPGRGYGLGLYIAQKLLHEHGGDLRFPPSGDDGTTVHARFPLRPKP